MWVDYLGGGEGKGYVGPLSNYLGGAAPPPPWPPLPQPMSPILHYNIASLKLFSPPA